jgi:hypothetical protein
MCFYVAVRSRFTSHVSEILGFLIMLLKQTNTNRCPFFTISSVKDIETNIVNTEAEAYDRQTSYSLLHPDKLVFFDEVEENISQKGDGNAGGQKFIVAKDMRAQVRNSFKYNHFTVLGFTEVDERAVMCAIIIAASKLKVTDETGFNPLSKDTEDVSSNDMKVLEDEIDHMKCEQQ